MSEAENDDYLSADHTPETVETSLYVPKNQKQIWKEEADEMGMGYSEYVRSMVQKGRRGFTLGETAPKEPSTATQVLDIIKADGPISVDGIVDELTDELEGNVDDALEELQASNEIRYRDGFVPA